MSHTTAQDDIRRNKCWPKDWALQGNGGGKREGGEAVAEVELAHHGSDADAERRWRSDGERQQLINGRNLSHLRVNRYQSTTTTSTHLLFQYASTNTLLYLMAMGLIGTPSSNTNLQAHPGTRGNSLANHLGGEWGVRREGGLDRRPM